MKVYIITEGGRDIGYGHLARCVSIYQAFLEKNIKPVFIVNSSLQARDFLRDNGVTSVTDTDRGITREDIAVIDSYLKPRDYYSRIREASRLLVSVDDFKRIEYPAGLVVNGAVYAEDMAYKRTDGMEYLLGAEYIPLRKSFWNACRRKIRKNKKSVLLTFGGFHDGFANRIARQIKKELDLDLHIVAAPDGKRAGSPKMNFYRGLSAEGMKELMLSADACVSAGGQTTYELARCGVPAIGICFARNQLSNLKGWAKKGALEFAGWHDDKNILRKITGSLEGLDYVRRLKMSSVGRAAIDGQGARRLVREILQYA